MSLQPRLLEIKQGVLDKNDHIARGLRDQFTQAGVLVINLVSSPGAGKTLLLEKTLTALKAHGMHAAALVGDLETDNDARRLTAAGVPVRQIFTAGNCHLEAQMITDHLAGWSLDDLDYLFIENVGNLVCPANYDLGETMRVVILSVTEGEDKPLKYPPMFISSDVAVITKIDIADAVDFDKAVALANIQAVHPGIPVLEVSAKTGLGMDAWLTYLESQRVILHPA